MVEWCASPPSPPNHLWFALIGEPLHATGTERVFAMCRGVEGLPNRIGSFELPPTARLVASVSNSSELAPLGFHELVNVPLGTSGLMLGTMIDITMSVCSRRETSPKAQHCTCPGTGPERSRSILSRDAGTPTRRRIHPFRGRLCLGQVQKTTLNRHFTSTLARRCPLSSQQFPPLSCRSPVIFIATKRVVEWY